MQIFASYVTYMVLFRMERYKKKKMVFFYMSANITILGRLLFFTDVWVDYGHAIYLFLLSIPIYAYLLCGLSY